MADAEGNLFGPFDLTIPGSEAEPFTESAWETLYGHVSGVREGMAVSLAGLVATLTPGLVVSHGFYLDTRERAAAWSYASPATAVGGNPRRDLVVARRQLSLGDASSGTPGKTSLVVIPGTPAVSPVDPAYDAANDELIASWLVPGNAGTVASAAKDLRKFLTSQAQGAPAGLVAHAYSTSSASTNSAGDETRVTTGTANWTGTLTAGRKYRITGQGQFDTFADGSVPELYLRARRGATPITTSFAVGVARGYLASQARPQTWQLDGTFQVAVTGSHTLSPFLRRFSVNGGAASIQPTASGIWEFMVTDIGVAESWVPTVP